MNREEHIQKHKKLHKALDELVADYITHNKNVRLKEAWLLDFMEWSYTETLKPTEDPNDPTSSNLGN